MKIKKYVACVLTCGLLVGMLAGCGKNDQAKASAEQEEVLTQAEESQTSSWIRVWGPVLETGTDSITIDNRSENGSRGELVLMIDPETTRLLDGEDGDPEELSDLEKGDPVFAYIEQVMTLSLPPMVSAAVIFCDIPDDLRVPEYVRVTEMNQQSDGSYLMTADNNMQYTVPENCKIRPYLTKNVVTLGDVQPESTCLVWRNEKLEAKKILLFPS